MKIDQWCVNGRGERIRTSGLYVPNVALYQAKLHPDVEPAIVAKAKVQWGWLRCLGRHRDRGCQGSGMKKALWVERLG